MWNLLKILPRISPSDSLLILATRHLYSTPRRFVKEISSENHDFIQDHRPPKAVDLLPKSKYGGEHIVTLLTGSTTIGEQGARYVSQLFSTAKVPVCFEHITLTPDKDTLKEYLMSVLRNRTAIHVDLQHDPESKAISLRMNNDLDLFASMISLRTFDGFRCRHPDLNLTLFIQNNTGDFSKLEYEPVPGVVETLTPYEESSTRKFVEYAFECARKGCHKKVTIAHKRAALPKTDGMLLNIAKELHEEKYCDLELHEMNVDWIVLNLVRRPQIFDFIVSNARYGTFLASVASAVCGGAGLFSAVEMNRTHAVFKPLQTKLSVTDCRVLSPYGIVSACVELLDHLGNAECADVLRQELWNTMLEKQVKTKEYGGDNREEFIICNIVNGLKCKFSE